MPLALAVVIVFSSQSSSPRPFITRSFAAAILWTSEGFGSNVWTSPPFGTTLVVFTWAPPTCWTMSANTVVVVTTSIGAPVAADGVGAAVEQAATSRTASPRPPAARPVSPSRARR